MSERGSELASPVYARVPRSALRAPRLPAGAGPWLNGPPLVMEGLRGGVVLVDFWISCTQYAPGAALG